MKVCWLWLAAQSRSTLLHIGGLLALPKPAATPRHRWNHAPAAAES
jgi:hypothetical protein